MSMPEACKAGFYAGSDWLSDILATLEGKATGLRLNYSTNTERQYLRFHRNSSKYPSFGCLHSTHSSYTLELLLLLLCCMLYDIQKITVCTVAVTPNKHRHILACISKYQSTCLNLIIQVASNMCNGRVLAADKISRLLVCPVAAMLTVALSVVQALSERSMSLCQQRIVSRGMDASIQELAEAGRPECWMGGIRHRSLPMVNSSLRPSSDIILPAGRWLQMPREMPKSPSVWWVQNPLDIS
ncbi:uncharacterized protein BP01DRAFT_426895 [Aspergillus saccharolyticus JOP 1030-1]|uniref:Uncharacterized protein n=1 Tax=Aspergillus saccharolyticus JOP 1030-1 TaxID=1450539 RepID=A0A318ZB97_9EURO|nr:hypothetical protein BP01DRAFT_426895 [Aspergillus saccharolyticus JOP 1030-1]PYH40720.1 hypothetical protein BP01DRAFT_426895 [Aspergillus saccharolyticus JOP 1030-1]